MMKYIYSTVLLLFQALHLIVKKKIRYKKLISPFFFFGILSFSAYSQSQPAGIKSILASIDTFRNRIPAEKLYLHFDKPYYSTGDTIWFKAYLFDATFMTTSEKSGIVYLELANDTNKVLLRRMLPITSGLGRGNIVLNKDDIPEGSYSLRAYTNLMRNLGDERIFKKSFYIGGSSDQSWLVNSNSILSKEAGKENLRLGLQFQTLNKQAVGLHEMQVRVMEGKKVLLRDKVQTDIDGKLDVNFNIPEKADAKNISIVAEDMAKLTTHKITIPIPVNRPGNTDLQFMPEGGNLVSGIASRIGFKAIGEDGKAVEVSGKVYSNSKNSGSSSSGSSNNSSSGSEEVAVFSTTHKGMGSFELLPKAGENYTAKIILNDGTTKSYPLPLVKNSGTVLRITNRKESDTLEVRVYISPDILPSSASATLSAAAATKSIIANTTSSPSTYYLIGQSGNVVCYAASVQSNAIVRIPKKLFYSGIARFSLFNEEKLPLNERIVYIDHDDNLKISIQTDKSSYRTRDSIALDIQVSDKEGKAVRGSFSVAITDDAQVRTDSLSGNMLSNLHLTSDLKGNIEEPGYYFNKTNEQVWKDLDNLLLTQGWVGYSQVEQTLRDSRRPQSEQTLQDAAYWQKVFNPKLTAQYEAEQEFTVKGKVTNIFNRELESTHAVLISIKPLFFKDTLTNKEGKFIFNGFPPIDTAVFRLQASNRKGKQFNVGIEVEEFKPPIFQNDQRFMPWYVNSDTTLLNYVKSTITQHEEELKLYGNGHLLNEVTITAKKIVKGSKNLNGEGNADITLDETDAKKAGKMNLLQLIQQRISFFFEKVERRTLRRFFTLNGFELKVVIDGMDLDFFYTPGSGGRGPNDPNDHYWYVRNYLEYFSMEDIKGIELMKYGKYSFMYTSEFENGFPPPQYSWVEVTTRSGKGLFMKPTPGTYLYKAMPFASTKQFYNPKYSPKNSASKLIDLRSTIYWEPDIITDSQGKATVSFYSADTPGTYTIITEGSDMYGNVGSKKDKIIVKP